MQIAAHDVSRLSRALAGCAGLAVAAFGALSLLDVIDAVRPAEALWPAGLALFLAVLPVGGRYLRIPAYLLAVLAAVLGAVMSPYLAGALLALAMGAILARPETGLVAYLVRSRAGADRQQRELVAELHARQEFDIADPKQAEEALSRPAAELMRSNDQLREANARLEAALAFKNDLTSMLTHDVAQPISSIASLSELLASDWADLPEEVRLELATKIDKNTHRLIKMMNDLQLLFRLDTGSVTARRTPVPLREVVEAVATDVPAGTVEIAVGEDMSALADRGHLTAVVQNLLNNALAYGESPVQIRADRQADTVRLVVQDRGTGIPEDLVPKLFDRFVRGAGLGLFIVRHLVEANGGSVRYERAEPRGARLIVTLESASVSG
ncbi:MAG TPA: HAMP domain-containing sensor histidine kinase [Actinoplanes sp.]|nr:HAMP domain-containing sensor histidine kinase [Actinoplanes sp.]